MGPQTTLLEKLIWLEEVKNWVIAFQQTKEI
jgi:hypothetical protein